MQQRPARSAATAMPVLQVDVHVDCSEHSLQLLHLLPPFASSVSGGSGANGVPDLAVGARCCDLADRIENEQVEATVTLVAPCPTSVPDSRTACVGR
eukprot:1506902-Rhodomonas_salina.3